MRIVGGELAGRRFGAPSGSRTRPTADRVREALGSALESRGAFDDAVVLDLFAGSGALSFEALSRGASIAVAVDSDTRALREIEVSAKALGLADRVHVLRVDLGGKPGVAARRIRTAARGFDLVFADAPYAMIDLVPPLIDALHEAALFRQGAKVVIEHPSAHPWKWTKGLASDADYRYGQTRISLGVYEQKGTK
ncbi:MAG: RsmD family RNA methyltransferase [Myxococcota bacterium]